MKKTKDNEFLGKRKKNFIIHLTENFADWFKVIREIIASELLWAAQVVWSAAYHGDGCPGFKDKS